VLIVGLCGTLPAQQQYDQWRFGHGSELDLKTTPPTSWLGAALPTISPPILTGSFIEGTASVADRNPGAPLL